MRRLGLWFLFFFFFSPVISPDSFSSDEPLVNHGRSCKEIEMRGDFVVFGNEFKEDLFVV